MKRDWTIDEIIEHFTLLEDEQKLVKANALHNKLGKALLLKFFQSEARFPEDRSEIPLQAVDYIAQQLGLSPTVLKRTDGVVVASKIIVMRSASCTAFAHLL